MSLDDALKLISTVLAQVQLNLGDHQKLQQALQIVAEAAKKGS